MVRQDELGFIAQPKGTCACRYYPSFESSTRAHNSQIIPVVTNAADAVNFRNIRESLSLDLENQDLCHSTPPSVSPSPGRRVTGENGQWLSPGAKTPSVAGSPGPGSPPQHEDLFVGFSSVTLHHDGEIS